MEKHMIQATIRMTIPPKKSGEALRILRSVAEQCKDQPGCLSCHIYGDLQEKNVLTLEEVWAAEENLDLHMRSDEYHNLLLLLEMSLKQPRSGSTRSRVRRGLRPSKRQEAARDEYATFPLL